MSNQPIYPHLSSQPSGAYAPPYPPPNNGAYPPPGAFPPAPYPPAGAAYPSPGQFPNPQYGHQAVYAPTIYYQPQGPGPMGFGEQVNIGHNQASVPLLPPGQSAVWMNRPQALPGCPEGLEYLTMIDNILVEQIPSLLEAFVGWDTNNKYILKNAAGQQVYFAAEKSSSWMRFFCGAQRGFSIHIVDNLNQDVMTVTREYKCCAGFSCFAGCCDCCAHEITVTSKNGDVIGYVKQGGSCCTGPKFWILDDHHEPVLKLEGPCCMVDGPFCPCENVFKILTLGGDNTQIGGLSKVYSGFINELVTVADRFQANFPMDLSVKVKATLIAALFLIDFMFFEVKQNN